MQNRLASAGLWGLRERSVQVSGQHRRGHRSGYSRPLSDFLSLTRTATMTISNTPAISQSMPCLSVFRELLTI